MAQYRGLTTTYTTNNDVHPHSSGRGAAAAAHTGAHAGGGLGPPSGPPLPYSRRAHLATCASSPRAAVLFAE